MADHALSYLSAKGIKIKHAVADIARSLNEAGLRPPYGGSYGEWHVMNWLYGRSKDENIELHIIEFQAKGTGKEKAVQDLIDAARQLMAA